MDRVHRVPPAIGDIVEDAVDKRVDLLVRQLGSFWRRRPQHHARDRLRGKVELRIGSLVTVHDLYAGALSCFYMENDEPDAGSFTPLAMQSRNRGWFDR